MIPYSEIFDQSTFANMIEYDALVQRYRLFFSCIDWKPIELAQMQRTVSRRHTHPDTAYIKAFLIKILEGKTSMRDFRLYLVEHPCLIIELGFYLRLEPSHPYGFDIEKTVPKKTLLTNETMDGIVPV